MKIIIECTKEEKEKILREKCPNQFIGYDLLSSECDTIFSLNECKKCYKKNNIEFKIVENKD